MVEIFIFHQFTIIRTSLFNFGLRGFHLFISVKPDRSLLPPSSTSACSYALHVWQPIYIDETGEYSRNSHNPYLPFSFFFFESVYYLCRVALTLALYLSVYPLRSCRLSPLFKLPVNFCASRGAYVPVLEARLFHSRLSSFGSGG